MTVSVEPGQSVGVGTLLGCVYHMGDRGGPAHTATRVTRITIKSKWL